MTIIENEDELDYKGGGVLTTATALGNSLVKRLSDKGVTFERPVEI
jgi:short subunit dehydrogenase-like uncharacterized protein